MQRRPRNKNVIPVGKKEVARSETNGAAPPSRQWDRFLRDVEWYDLVTAIATSCIAVMTGLYVYYTHGELNAIRTQLEYTRETFHLEHRPWVVISRSRLSAELGTNTKAPISIKLWVRNTGNTPALEVHYEGKIAISDSPPVMPRPTSVRAIAQPGTTSETPQCKLLCNQVLPAKLRDA